MRQELPHVLSSPSSQPTHLVCQLPLKKKNKSPKSGPLTPAPNHKIFQETWGFPVSPSPPPAFPESAASISDIMLPALLLHSLLLPSVELSDFPAADSGGVGDAHYQPDPKTSDALGSGWYLQLEEAPIPRATAGDQAFKVVKGTLMFNDVSWTTTGMNEPHWPRNLYSKQCLIKKKVYYKSYT